MKNLANCKPSEFLKQTNRIRKSVSKWLTDTDIANIRKRMPNIKDDASDIVFITTSREIEKFFNPDTNQYSFVGTVGHIDYRNFDIKVKGRLSRVK
jgi:hypothetical protein